MNTLVQALETNVQAARIGLRELQEKFEHVSKEISVSNNTSEHFMTITMVFGGTAACREYTLFRESQNSEPVGWVRGHTKIGQAQVHVYSDSVLCLRKMFRRPEFVEKWKEQLQQFQSTNDYK